MIIPSESASIVRLVNALSESLSHQQAVSNRAGQEQAVNGDHLAGGGPAWWRRNSHIIIQATGVFLATRLAWLAFTALLLPLEANLHPSPATSAGFSLRGLALSWVQWDSIWYIGIAQHGYSTPQATAFFPLYPLMIRGLTLLFGTHWLLASLLVANVGTWCAVIGVGLLAAYTWDTNDSKEGDSKEKVAFSALRMEVAYPLAFFLTAPYSDGLFLAAATFGLLTMRMGKWGLATLCVCLALLTRSTGVILLAPLIFEYGRQHSWWRRQAWAPWLALVWPRLGAMFLILGGSSFGIGLYMLFLFGKFGDPLLFLHAESQFWHHSGILDLIYHNTAPARPAAPVPATPAPPGAIWGYNQARSLVDLAPVIIFAVLTIIGARRLPVTYTLYMVGLVTLIVISPRPHRLGLFVSAGRYLIAAVPIFILLGSWARRYPWFDMLMVSCGFLLQAVLAAYFLAGGWVV
jgi:hypothetical protein